MTIYVYARVSSAKQATSENVSLEFQTDQCSAFARMRYPHITINVVKEIHSARAIKKQNRLARILDLIEQGDIFIFYNVSRLTRDASAGIKLLSNLAKRNIKIHSVFEKLSYPADRATFRRLLVDANEESDTISDRVRGAISHIRQKNGHIGRPAFGYKTVRDSSDCDTHSYRPLRLVFRR